MRYNRDIDNSMVLARGKGGWLSRGGQAGGINGMERDVLGQRTHNGVCRGCFVERYIKNLFGFVNLCHLNKLKKKQKTKKNGNQA